MKTIPSPATDELLAQRRLAISKSTVLTGLDYVKYVFNASLNTSQLELHFIVKATGISGDIIPPGMTLDNIQITIKTPGTGNTLFTIKSFIVPNPPPSTNVWPLNLTNSSIDQSDNTVYTLSLIDLNDVDIFLSEMDFSICANTQATFDPLQSSSPSTVNPAQPPYIDYLSRDYLSFRQLMLSRLSVLIPDWQASNPADLGSVIIEILAYAADYLSYYQDAVATEAYLETARLRISVKRHTRLLDYVLSEGCNARVWVHVDVSPPEGQPSLLLPAKTLLLTPGSASPGPIALNSDTYKMLINEGVLTFATLYNTTLYPEFNLIDFYTWGSQELTLSAGATSASLKGNFLNLQGSEDPTSNGQGDVLVLVQVKGTATGLPEDADPTQRWAVRLTTVTLTSDPLYNQAVTEITWNAQDALPFDFVISSIINGSPITAMSQARGNMVLADQGQFVYNEPLIPAIVPNQGVYRPSLAQLNLTFSQPFDVNAANQLGASSATQQDPQQAQAYITLNEGNVVWQVTPDLLDSNFSSTDFVVEVDDNRRAFIRFGDGVFGALPLASGQFTADYRNSNGAAGNIGANTLAYIVVDPTLVPFIIGVTNPLPAQGGTDPESTAQAQLYAPKAFQQQERCVTVADYIEVVSGYPNATITSVNATLRWTGSWNTVFIAVQSDAPFNTLKQGLLNYLVQYQLLHHDCEIIPPQWVPLEIVLPILVKPGYIPNVVQQSLMQRFSSGILPDGSRGFFYPDNFTLGQPVYLSDIEVAIMEIEGVSSVDIASPLAIFRRLFDDSNIALQTQQITIGPLEIAELLNNPNISQTGTIQFIMESAV